MLWEAIINAYIMLFGFLVDLLDSFLPDPPGWVSTAYEWASQARAWLYSFNHVIPVDLALLAVGFVVSMWTVGMVLNVVRVVVSYFTLGGGAT